MFGGLSGSMDHKASVFKILNDDRLTPAQKSAYCFDQGICEKCGIKTHWVGPFARRPYTNERVWNGICRTCRPDECGTPQQQQQQESSRFSSSSFVPNPTLVFGQIQKMAVPPEALLAKTTSALGKLHSGVKEGIDTINDSIMKETRKMGRNSSRQQQRNSESSISGSSELTQQSQSSQDSAALPMLNIFGPTRDRAPPPPPKEPTTAFSKLKAKFQPNSGKSNIKSDPSSKEQQSLTDESNIPGIEELDGHFVKGKSVTTPFGKGLVLDYRPDDDIYVIALHHNLLCNNQSPSQKPPSNNNMTKLFCKKESFSVEHENKFRQKRSMELNEAYESLEKMRRCNLEVECQEHGVQAVDFDMCTVCLLHPDGEASTSTNQQSSQNFALIRKLVRDSQKRKASPPCLFCAAPCCVAHSNASFRKENITACLECCKLFDPDYVVDWINQAYGFELEKSSRTAEHGGEPMRERPVDHLMDLYDRVLLLLQYSSQYIESIAAALEENTKKYNNVNVRASSAGMVSGALGVAAAAAIFTPAGPPLLMASLLLGGGATTVQTSTEVVNYFSEPNKFADKIIALVGMLHSLLKVKEHLREILTARLLEQEGNPEIDRLKKSLDHLKEKQREAAFKAGTTVASTAMLSGVAMGQVAAAGATIESAAIISSVEMGALAGRNVNMLSKGGTALARGARFARFAGGALSAASLVLEARTMALTLEQIKAGHPCEKADALRGILKELSTLPTTAQLDEECRIYIGAMSNRVNSTSLEDAIKLIESNAVKEWQLSKAKAAEIAEGKDSNAEMAAVGASIVDGDDEYDDYASSNDNHDELALLSSALKQAQEQRMTQSLSGLPVERMPPGEITVVRTTNADTSTESALTVCFGSTVAASVATAPPRMAQSMIQPIPIHPLSPASQSSLLERIQKFKRVDSDGPAVTASTTTSTISKSE